MLKLKRASSGPPENPSGGRGLLVATGGHSHLVIDTALTGPPSGCLLLRDDKASADKPLVRIEFDGTMVRKVAVARYPRTMAESSTPSRRTTRDIARLAFLVAVPALTAVVIAGHPADPRTASDLGDQVDLYIWIHVALLFMLPLLGIVVWTLLDGLRGAAATVSRVLLPVALVFYAAFDALVGIGGGLVVREALAVGAADRTGAEDLAARWMTIPMPVPIISTMATFSWTAALLAAAAAHAQARSPVIAVIGLALAGPLFGFGHPFVTGLIGMAGLAVAGVAIESSKRVRPGEVDAGTVGS
jgi:hypothetical protein